MSLKGGYKILDLSQNPSYDEIAKILDTEKVILISGLVVSGVKQKDCFASVEENEGVYTLKTPDKTFIVNQNGIEETYNWLVKPASDDSTITFSNLSQNNKSEYKTYDITNKNLKALVFYVSKSSAGLKSDKAIYVPVVRKYDRTREESLDEQIFNVDIYQGGNRIIKCNIYVRVVNELSGVSNIKYGVRFAIMNLDETTVDLDLIIKDYI